MIEIIGARGSVGAHDAPARPGRYFVNIARRPIRDHHSNDDREHLLNIFWRFPLHGRSRSRETRDMLQVFEESATHADRQTGAKTCVAGNDRTSRTYWFTVGIPLLSRIPASLHMRRMGATATSVSCVVSCLESGHPITAIGSTYLPFVDPQHILRSQAPHNDHPRLLA